MQISFSKKRERKYASNQMIFWAFGHVNQLKNPNSNSTLLMPKPSALQNIFTKMLNTTENSLHFNVKVDKPKSLVQKNARKVILTKIQNFLSQVCLKFLQALCLGQSTYHIQGRSLFNSLGKNLSNAVMLTQRISLANPLNLSPMHVMNYTQV